MLVTVLEHTMDPEILIAKSAMQCKSSEAADRFSTPSDDHVAKLIEGLLEAGHLSVFEHASITFGISGISRACSHQLVRHRMASFSQQSQRYATLDEPDFVIPPSLVNNEKFRFTLTKMLGCYRLLLDEGVPAEDARYILPNATPTDLVMTMNFRELLHFFELRCCMRAQWEIRGLAYEMLRRAQLIAPNVFRHAGAPCDTCPQRCYDKEE